MTIRSFMGLKTQRASLIAIGATVALVLGTGGQSVAAQTAVPSDDGQRIVTAMSAGATASVIATAAQPATPVSQSEIEFNGILNAAGDQILTINGRTVAIAGAEVHGTLTPGAQVRVHAIVAADGSLTAREVELIAAPAATVTQTAGDDGATHDANDDHGADAASHD